MREADLPALLVTLPEDILYLAGFSGSSGALILTADDLHLVTDSRYFLQAEAESPAWTLQRMESGESVPEAVRRALGALGVRRVGFDQVHMTVDAYLYLGGGEETSWTLAPAAGLVGDLRMVKDAGEVAMMREAVRITDDAYAHVLSLARPGVTERELALEAEWFMRRHGADGMAFGVILASGPNAAMPHAVPGDRALQDGDLVIVDMGARYAHYCADMTRTFGVGDPPAAAREIYRVCHAAQMAGVTGIRAGMTGDEADAVVRRVIDDAGYGDYFGHGTGHGVGLHVHENPRLRRQATAVLPLGATVTVEPGIYLPGVGGVRIEDLVLLTESGPEVLTGAAKTPELSIVC